MARRKWLRRGDRETSPEMDVSVNTTLTALELKGVTKCFDRPAVDGLELTIRAGEFYALLGPNGAGKTTTLRIVAGLLKPDAGEVSVKLVLPALFSSPLH